MKTVIAILFVMSSTAMANTVVDARNTNCADLQSTLAAEGVIDVKGPFGWLNTHYASDDRCGANERSNISYVRAKDKLFCLSGYVCQPESNGGN